MAIFGVFSNCGGHNEIPPRCIQRDTYMKTSECRFHRLATRYWFVATIVMCLTQRSVTADEFVPSPEGYYEGSVLYSCNYLKGIGYASMILKNKADFWLTLTRSAHGTYIVDSVNWLNDARFVQTEK
jgi:hypothetical protein